MPNLPQWIKLKATGRFSSATDIKRENKTKISKRASKDIVAAASEKHPLLLWQSSGILYVLPNKNNSSPLKDFTFVSCRSGVETAGSGVSAAPIWASSCSAFSSSAFLSGVTVVIMFPLTAPSAALSFMRVSWFSIMGAGRQQEKDGCDGPEPMSLYGYHKPALNSRDKSEQWNKGFHLLLHIVVMIPTVAVSLHCKCARHFSFAGFQVESTLFFLFKEIINNLNF